jgi:hypothetical protein
MRVIVRICLIWLLALAVPLQGVAAATMLVCGPHHQAGGAVHASPDVQPHHHGAHSGDDAHAHHAMPGADVGASGLAQADGHTCSACATCCSALALVGTFGVPACPELASTLFDSVVPSVGRYCADGPDRPPRIHLA